MHSECQFTVLRDIYFKVNDSVGQRDRCIKVGAIISIDIVYKTEKIIRADLVNRSIHSLRLHSDTACVERQVSITVNRLHYRYLILFFVLAQISGFSTTVFRKNYVNHFSLNSKNKKQFCLLSVFNM